MPPHTAISDDANEIATQIEKLSNGKIKVLTYPSGSLLTETSTNNGLSNNTVNMALGGMRWWSSKIPALDWGTIPFMVNDAKDMVKALRGPAGTDINAQLNKFGVEMIGVTFYGYIKSFINTKRAIKSPSDLKGLTLRSEGKLAAMFLQSQGATPVAMDSSEVYTALQRGTLDGAMSGVTTFISRKWVEPAKYITAIRYVPQAYLVQVNKKWWEGLQSSQRKIIREAVAKVEVSAADRIDNDFDVAIANAKKAGAHVYVLKGTAREQWKAAAQPMAKKNFLESAGPLGQKLLDDIAKSN